MGIFPRVAYWDDDNLHDLLIGLTEGQVVLHRNIGTPGDPLFAEADTIRVGQPGEQVILDVGLRPTPIFADWNGDGRRDLVVGAFDGKIHLYINEGTDHEPLFLEETFAMTPGGVLEVPTTRASPDLLDIDGDGLFDLLSGNTDGQIAVFLNIGTPEEPLFTYFTLITSDGLPIDLEGSARSRPFTCDWNDDGETDLLIGTGDGLVRLYLGYDGGVTSSEGLVVTASTLLEPWPNPFNPTVSLACRIAADCRASLVIFDSGGRRVRELFDGEMSAGHHELRWNGRDQKGYEMPSGVYFARLEAGLTRESRKLVLLR